MNIYIFEFWPVFFRWIHCGEWRNSNARTYVSSIPSFYRLAYPYLTKIKRQKYSNSDGAGSRSFWFNSIWHQRIMKNASYYQHKFYCSEQHHSKAWSVPLTKEVINREEKICSPVLSTVWVWGRFLTMLMRDMNLACKVRQAFPDHFSADTQVANQHWHQEGPAQQLQFFGPAQQGFERNVARCLLWVSRVPCTTPQCEFFHRQSLWSNHTCGRS